MRFYMKAFNKKAKRINVNTFDQLSFAATKLGDKKKDFFFFFVLYCHLFLFSITKIKHKKLKIINHTLINYNYAFLNTNFITNKDQ